MTKNYNKINYLIVNSLYFSAAPIFQTKTKNGNKTQQNASGDYHEITTI